MDYNELLEIAIEAARAGGAVALAQLNQPGPVHNKGAWSVTNAGILAVQARIIEVLQAIYPDHAILSGELAAQPAPDAESLWIIDPVDGSLNYVKGIPLFAIAIGFRHKGIYRLGVVYDPCRDELFHAIRTQGAFLNGQRIKTRWVSEGVEAYQQSVVATDWPSSVEKRVANAMIVEIMAADMLSLQIFGSPSLGICYVAAGRLDAYFHLDLQLWDVAAAFVILEDAGGTVTDAIGAAWQHSDGAYLVTNSIVHGRMLDPIRLARDR